jgi:putative hydrolase of the HAD superfamily
MRVTPSVVIFDYGNVLSDSQPAADAEAMAKILGVSLPEFTEIYWRFRVAYDAAELSPDEYWHAVARAGARTLTPGQIAELNAIDAPSWSHPAPFVAEWARALRAAGLRIALLSNMPVTVRDYVIRCSWLPEFDARTFSCDVGVSKPAPEIYQDCLAKLGARPSDVLFLDDKEPNIRAAEALGMHAVLFTDVAAAASELDARFHLPVTLSNLIGSPRSAD